MSYYPIKCILCLRPIREAERCVKLTKDEIRSDNFEGIRQSDDISVTILLIRNYLTTVRNSIRKNICCLSGIFNKIFIIFL